MKRRHGKVDQFARVIYGNYATRKRMQRATRTTERRYNDFVLHHPAWDVHGVPVKAKRKKR